MEPVVQLVAETTTGSSTAPDRDAPRTSTHRPSTRRLYDPVEKALATTIHRSQGAQLRIYAVRMVARDIRAGEERPPEYVNVAIARWFKALGDLDEGWQPDRAPWRGGPLIFPTEVPLVAAALQRAVDLARERGWLR